MIFPYIDTLLTLPFVSYISYLFLPSALSSWTTSLNLFFFWMTWATIVFSHSPLAIEFYSTLAVRVIFYLLPSAFFLAFDSSIPSLSQSIKVHGSRALPFQATGASTSSTTKAHQRVARIAAVAISNTLLGVCLQIALEYFLTDLLHMRSVLSIKTRIPFPWAIVKDLTRAYILRGITAYYAHRILLHSATSSRYITRCHAEWAHSLNHIIPFTSAYDHIVPYLLHRFLPTYLPALLFRPHLLTYLSFLALTGLEEAFAFSGYSIMPSTILLKGIARRQESHLASGGTGNYAPYGILDWLHGTTVGLGNVTDDVRQEVECHDPVGKAQDALQSISQSRHDAPQQNDDSTGLNRRGERRRQRA